MFETHFEQNTHDAIIIIAIVTIFIVIICFITLLFCNIGNAFSFKKKLF